MEAAAERWIYLKLYVGEAIDRMDQLIVQLGRAVTSLNTIDNWFFLRYVDETGFHIRLRVRPIAELRETARLSVDKLSADALNRLHEMLPSTYYPMVVPPGLEEMARQSSHPHNDVNLVYDQYAPEEDKYGGKLGVEVAEDLFRTSSQIAVHILAEEAQGLYSRKTLVPMLMTECFRVFPSKVGAIAFWRQYGLYWLGGDTPAADDWREKFFQKGRELAAEGVEVRPIPETLPIQAHERLQEWRAGLEIAASRYSELGGAANATTEVLCFNFAHLMNNRLGLTALEEAYMAVLLEQSETEWEVASASLGEQGDVAGRNGRLQSGKASVDAVEFEA